MSWADFADGREIIEVTPHALFRLLSSPSCGVFVLASDQTVVFWNRRAREILLEVQQQDNQDLGLIFPGGRKGGPLSNMTHILVLRRLDIPAVPHGFRSSFRDWVIELTDTPWVVGEAALAHNLGNSTEMAYARTDLFDKRRDLMEAWGIFVAG